MHPQHNLGPSASHLRNAVVVKHFKPATLLAFHEKIEQSHSTVNFMKLAKQKNVDVRHFDGRK
jgi:hypothetical protein